MRKVTSKRQVNQSAQPINYRKVLSTVICSLIATQASANNEQVQNLEAMQIKGGALAAQTEGTGSYTTGSSDSATRLNISLKETPQSMSVISNQQMKDHNLTTLLDVLEQTPGIAIDRVDERVRFSSRGFDLNYMIDGIPTFAFESVAGEASMINTAMYDRVEVIRGATGLLNGVGSPGGAINLVRKRPTSEFAGSITAGVGSWNRYTSELDLSGSLSENDNVRGRMVASITDGDSFINYKEHQENLFYGIIEADLSPNTLLSFGYEHQNTDTKGANFGQAPLFFADGSPTQLPYDYNPSTPWSTWNMSTDRLFINLDHGFSNGWQLKANASYADNKRDRYSRDIWLYPGDIDPVTGNGVGDANYNPAEGLNKSLDVYATGPFELFGREHQAAVGFNINHYDYNYYNTGPIAGAFDREVINIFDLASLPQPEFTHLLNTSSGKIEEQSLFATAQFKPTDPLSILVGSRVTWYEATGSFQLWTWGLNGQLLHDPAKNEDAVVTPYFGLTYELNPDYSVYASYTDIFEPNTSRNSNNEILDPKRGSNIELGIKGSHQGGELNTSFAVFEAEEDNLAIVDAGAAPLPDGSTPYKAVKGAKSRGFEMTIAGEVLPDWQLMAGYTYHSKRNQDGDILDPTKPRRQLRLSTSYRLPGELNKLTIGGSLSYQSAIHYDEYYGAGRAEQGDVTLIGLMARYEFTPQLNATLNIENLTDKEYYSGLGGYNGYTNGNPRNMWLKVNYQF